MIPIRAEAKAGMELCSKVAPGNYVACVVAVLKASESGIDRCLADLRVKLEEVKKCRKDCRDKFREMMELDPN